MEFVTDLIYFNYLLQYFVFKKLYLILIFLILFKNSIGQYQILYFNHIRPILYFHLYYYLALRMIIDQSFIYYRLYRIRFLNHVFFFVLVIGFFIFFFNLFKIKFYLLLYKVIAGFLNYSMFFNPQKYIQNSTLILNLSLKVVHN